MVDVIKDWSLGHANGAVCGGDVSEVAHGPDRHRGRDGEAELGADLDGPLALLDLIKELWTLSIGKLM